MLVLVSAGPGNAGLARDGIVSAMHVPASNPTVSARYIRLMIPRNPWYQNTATTGPLRQALPDLPFFPAGEYRNRIGWFAFRDEREVR